MDKTEETNPNFFCEEAEKREVSISVGFSTKEYPVEECLICGKINPVESNPPKRLLEICVAYNKNHLCDPEAELEEDDLLIEVELDEEDVEE